jgi:hypothetical protein
MTIFCCKQHKTIDSVLARGEKLDSLVEKSSDLSAASQVSNTAPVLQLCPPALSHELMCGYVHSDVCYFSNSSCFSLLKFWCMWLWYSLSMYNEYCISFLLLMLLLVRFSATLLFK